MSLAPFILVFISFCSPDLSFVDASTRNVLSIDLIHRDSLYNRSLTPSQLLRMAVLRSFASVKRFHSSIYSDAKYTISLNGDDYLMKISQGSNYNGHALVSTRMNFIWIDCFPNKHRNDVSEPLFHPLNSKTYSTVPHGDELCKSLKTNYEGDLGECRYEYDYEENQYIYGVLSKDLFSLGSTNDNPLEIVFGCNQATVVNHIKGDRVQGVVGLGKGILSLASQLTDGETQNNFGYCLVPRFLNTNSKLKIGYPEVEDTTVSTSFTIKPRHPYYYLTLKGISFGTKLDVPKPFGDIIIDSGSTITFLHSTLYRYLTSLIFDNLEYVDPIPDPSNAFYMCFKTVRKIGFPDMIFHFEGADVHLKYDNVIVEYEGIFCLAISPHDSLSVFGNTAQTNFLVEYDLTDEKISFTPKECKDF